MDPFSALILLGAGLAMASSTDRTQQASTRQQQLQTALGMAQPPQRLPVAAEVETDLPEESSLHWSDVSLWEIFRYPGMHVNLQLTALEWHGNKADLDNLIHHTGYTDKGLGYWQVQGEVASSEPRSLWYLMHRAWVGQAPRLTIDVRFGQDGKNTMGEIVVTGGSIEVDVHVVGDEIEMVAQSYRDSWLDPDDIDISGDSFVDCFTHQLNDVAAHAHYLDLGHMEGTLESETFTGLMEELVERFSQLDSDVSSTEGELVGTLNEIARDCAREAQEEADRYRSDLEEEEEDEDDWDDEDDEDEDDEWDEEDDDEEDDD